MHIRLSSASDKKENGRGKTEDGRGKTQEERHKTEEERHKAEEEKEEKGTQHNVRECLGQLKSTSRSSPRQPRPGSSTHLHANAATPQGLRHEGRARLSNYRLFPIAYYVGPFVGISRIFSYLSLRLSPHLAALGCPVKAQHLHRGLHHAHRPHPAPAKKRHNRDSREYPTGNSQ